MPTFTTHLDAEIQEQLRGPSLAGRASQLKWLLAFAQQDIGGLQESEWKEVEEGPRATSTAKPSRQGSAHAIVLEFLHPNE